jgi:mono/diheme cytochrome c family protein
MMRKVSDSVGSRERGQVGVNIWYTRALKFPQGKHRKCRKKPGRGMTPGSGYERKIGFTVGGRWSVVSVWFRCRRVLSFEKADSSWSLRSRVGRTSSLTANWFEPHLISSWFKFGEVFVRLNLKILRCALAVCSVTFALATALGQTTPAASLTDNPVFQKDCAKCHGKTAQGRHFGGPSLVSEKVAAASADELRGMIANGKGHMPKFGGKLTPEQIDALAEEIRAVNRK